MSRTYRQKQLNGVSMGKRRNMRRPTDGVEKLGEGFTAVRPLDRAQSEAAHEYLSTLVPRIGALQIRGYHTSKPPGAILFSKMDTQSLRYIYDEPRQKFLNELYDSIPSLTKPLSVNIYDVQGFGNTTGSRLSIAAAIERYDGQWPEERGQIETNICERSGWIPLGLRALRPMVTLAVIPRSTPEELQFEIRQGIQDVIGSTLHLERASLIAS